jgi:hypothetical protein
VRPKNHYYHYFQMNLQLQMFHPFPKFLMNHYYLMFL